MRIVAMDYIISFEMEEVTNNQIPLLKHAFHLTVQSASSSTTPALKAQRLICSNKRYV